MRLVESIPNVSEAQDTNVVDACKAAILGTGARLLDVHQDVDHNRSVFTIAGSAENVAGAVQALADTAVTHIDLRRQRGVHPRVGALDVVPFVPLGEVSMDDCAALARSVGASLAARHRLPVFLYEAAATHPTRRRLEAIRRGGLAGLSDRMRSDRDWAPDYGPGSPHPSAGVTVVGARGPLIAWNINLATTRIEVAQAVARRIRESGGGLPRVKALGVPLAHRGLVQVTMNLTDYRVTSMGAVYDAVSAAAAGYGVGIMESEIVGLVPADALTDDDADRFRIRGYDGSQILERRLALTS